MSFKDKVYEVVAKIPNMKTNPYMPRVPCHRVIRSDGKLGGYSGVGGSAEKLKMLLDEGAKLN